MTEPHLLITAGPTHEPIDAVRYLANRSSGRLGIALAERAVARGWRVTLLLGPTPRVCGDTRVDVHRFRTTSDLQGLLQTWFPKCDALVMAAAVADYRAKLPEGFDPDTSKLKRGGSMTLELESTPDLLAECSARREAQFLVGFALEPFERLEASARAKLERKGLDMIVANPLETMDSGQIEASVFSAAGGRSDSGVLDKTAFADWLLDILAPQIPTRTPSPSRDGGQVGRQA